MLTVGELKRLLDETGCPDDAEVKYVNTTGGVSDVRHVYYSALHGGLCVTSKKRPRK